MGSKFRIIFSLVSLIIYLSLVEEVEPILFKYISKFGKAAYRTAKPALGPLKKVRSKVNIVNDVTTLVTGIDGVVNLIKNDKSDEIFQDKVARELESIFTMCQKISDDQLELGDFGTIVKIKPDYIIREITKDRKVQILQEFEKKLQQINDDYKREFAEVWGKLRNYHRDSVDDYLKQITENNNFKENLKEIGINSRNSSTIESVFEKDIALYDPMNGYKLKCDDVAPLDELYDFYERIISTVARGYTMLILSFQRLKENASDPRYRQDAQEASSRHFKEDIVAITQLAKHVFNRINNTNYLASIACDPKKWKEGENFIRIKNYVSTETTSYWASFKIRAERFNETIEYDCDYGIAQYPNRFFDAPDTISAPCTTPFASTLNLTNVGYEEYEHYHNRILKRKCQHASTMQFNSMCESDKNSDPVLSIRKLSLILQSCRTDINEVVTNARFYEKDGIISIQVECGTLIDGEIVPESVRWNEDDRRFTRKNHPNFVVLNATLKSFNLDDMVVPDGELLTGVKFEVVDNNFISLAIQGSKIHNYYNGTTIGESNLYVADNSGREIIELNRTLGRPSKIMEQTYEMSKPGKNYINLIISEYSEEYHNEALFPYLDTSLLNAPPLAPLGGLGLFYKSVPGYAGFLALKYLVPKYINFIDIDNLESSSLTNAQDPLLTNEYET